MIIVKIIILFLIFISSSSVGILLAKGYDKRVEELKEFRNALNMLKTKIKFTYEPLPEMFNQIAETTTKEISKIFSKASIKMKKESATKAWIESIEEGNFSLDNEDINIIKKFGKLLR